MAMGNIAKIWEAVADQTMELSATQTANKGEFVAAINALRRQMESARADLEEANARMNRHRSVLEKQRSQQIRLQQHSNFVANQVTILEGDRGHGRHKTFETLLERMDRQETLIQDLREEVAILQGNRCRCFDAGSGSLGMADAELEYVDEGAEV